jgi:hypothetical protein
MDAKKNQMNIPRADALTAAWAATALLMLSGCSQQESSSPKGRDPVPTHSMYMHLFAEAHGDIQSARVIAVLTRDSDSLAHKGWFGENAAYPEHDFILEGGDVMQGCLAGSCQPLAAHRFINSVSIGGYETHFPVVTNTDYTVMLNRPVAVSANANSVQIPSYFTLATPHVHQVFGPGDEILISWHPIGLENMVRVNASIGCMSPGDGLLTFGSAGTGQLMRTFPQHQGSVAIPIDELVSKASQSRPQTQIAECLIRLGVAHERSGTVDPAFRGGEAIGRIWVGTQITYRQ